MNYLIRELRKDEINILDTFLYEAIFVPEGVPAPPKDIIKQPELQVYVKDFGHNKDDLCLVAQINEEIIGAVWVRIMDDYGHIDNKTPSFAISLLREYRNHGIGTLLMQQMLAKFN
ncbi:MAG: GNAT family N-acetyltransferase [Lachnospira sp.]|nr:GNAT family N-acetyltransferase [Lachnospira sp.]